MVTKRHQPCFRQGARCRLGSRADTPEAWAQTRTLWVVHPDGTGVRELAAAGSGVYAPQWSRDGRSLLFARDSAVWLMDASGRTAAERVAAFLDSAPTKYYGHLTWTSLVARTGGCDVTRPRSLHGDIRLPGRWDGSVHHDVLGCYRKTTVVITVVLRYSRVRGRV